MKYTDIFERNSETSNIVIEVALDNYDDYYHEWDNAKYRMRDINPDLYAFLEECSDQIPLRERLEIDFNLEGSTRNEQREKEIRESYQYFNNSIILAQSEKLRTTRLSVLKSAFFGVILLWASFFSSGIIVSDNLFIEIAMEGLLIGGWVFIWEAIYMLAFSLSEELEAFKRIVRLKNAVIKFGYLSK